MKEKIKKIIKIALYFTLIVGAWGVIMDLISFISSNSSPMFYSFIWLLISAIFIERIHKGKIRKLGWILAGIFSFIGITSFGVGFIFVLINLLYK